MWCKHPDFTKIVDSVFPPNTANPLNQLKTVMNKLKAISKPICKIIKEVLPSLIDQSQGAFVKERKLLYNVLICQDVARGYQGKNISPRCLLKIDLQKAFDSIH